MTHNKFLQQLDNRVLFLDGGMGTSVQSFDLTVDGDFWGKENCTEVLVLSRPDIVRKIHDEFLEAGSDGVETDTFGGMIHVLSEFDLQDRCREINRKACQIAKEACEAYSTPEKPRFVIGSFGPGTKLVSLGQIDFDTMYDSFKEAAFGQIEGGADVFLVETQQDILCIKASLNAICDALDESGKSPDDIPIMVQVTIEQFGTTLTGSEICAAAVALQNYPIISLGMNCATGPDDMAEHVEWLAKHWDRRISLLPNAGLPVLVEGRTEYPLKPQPFADTMNQFVDRFGLSIVGGCCGTTPEHQPVHCRGLPPGQQPSEHRGAVQRQRLPQVQAAAGKRGVGRDRLRGSGTGA